MKIWLVFGGVGLFLFGMYLLESALTQLSSRNFKLMLRRNTSTNIRGLFSGILTTAILQSSSVVSFMTLAFTGSGMIRMQNALAVILGANIGTTLANWIIATVGFSMNIESLWYPVLGLGGLLLVIFEHNKKIRNLCLFFIGFSFLFVALGFMKNGMLETVRQFDFSAYSGYHPSVFILIGFLLTFIIQSSSATVAITLSALYAKAIPFELAAAVVIGSELGTSLKLVLGSAGGSAAKKQLVAGNILINLMTTLVASLLMYPLIRLITETADIRDPLIGLVAFQTLINLLAAIICFPFLNKLSKGLLRMFRDVEQRSTLYLEKNLPAMPTLAIEMFRLEVFYFLKRVLNFTVREFNISPDETGIRKLFTEREWKRESPAEISSTHYEEIKHAQGEMMEYFVALQKLPLQPEELHEINQEIKSVHSAMHAAKGFKDILHNRTELLQSANDIKFEKFALFSAAIKQTHSRFASILATVDRQAAFEELAALLQDIQHTYSNLLDSIYRETAGQQLPDKDVSTLQNMNRELYSANKSLIYALADFLLESQQSEDLKSLPLLVR